ncbi:hypothetical protein [Streptomyces sp. CAU 1734]|uniref:hypothetical protein n=1 Tax=Streptomyces sp. CAU 1734 TaxID=3140360 RepID=UPI003260D5B5
MAITGLELFRACSRRVSSTVLAYPDLGAGTVDAVAALAGVEVIRNAPTIEANTTAVRAIRMFPPVCDYGGFAPKLIKQWSSCAWQAGFGQSCRDNAHDRSCGRCDY